MIVAVASPAVFYLLVQRTGWGTWLFERPAWAWLDRPVKHRDDQAALTAK
jgi:uncharacterized membrane protein YcfT